jgi:hypothetical protein
MVSHLKASFAKVERAESKLTALKMLINGYIKSAPYQIIVKREPDRLYLIARRVKEPPEDIAWELVEAVLHLRAALDKMVVSWVDDNGHGTSGIGFPFGGLDQDGQPRPFPDLRVEQRVRKKLTPNQWALIEAQRPHPAGNITLWAINEIANEDKHRKDLVTANARVSTKSFMLGPAGPGPTYNDFFSINPTDCDLVLSDKERETVLLAKGTKGSNERLEQKINGSVVFANVDSVKGREVLTTLSEQILITRSILNEALLLFKSVTA